MASLKELASRGDLLAPGHRACAGCANATVLRQIILAAGPNTVIGMATGCMEVVTTIFPFNAWRVPFIHNAFENSAATISGVEAAYRSLKKQGKINKEINFIAFGGDGGTYDIGIQSLSGAMERGHRMLYVCYNNEAYMNTGIQRSSATPFGADTSTTPIGSESYGKQGMPKDLTAIMIAHELPFVAQAAPHNWNDLTRKVEKALKVDGPSFINVLAPCYRGWRIPMEESIESSRLAADTCFWPLFEVEDGKWKLNYTPKEKKPLIEWIKPQGRFKHLLKEENKHIIESAQVYVDKKWQELLDRCK